MAENSLLVAIQKRKKKTPSLSAKGISLASWHVAAYLQSLQHAAGSKSKLTQFQKAHKLDYNWPAILKAAENKLIYQDDETAITKGIHASGEKFGEYTEEITPKSAMDFDCILTTKSKDRDGDVLEPTGANIDRKMPLLLHHLPTEPVGRFVKLIRQDDAGVIIKNAIVSTPLGHDTAVMVDFGCFRVSHGFEPKEYEPLSVASAYKDSALNGILTEEDAGWHVKTYDVMEVSLVTIPSNPDAEILKTFMDLQAKGKFHHPFNKLYAGKLLEDRPAMVTSGFDGEKNVINVTIHNGQTALKTKAKKQEEEMEEEEEKDMETPEEEEEAETPEEEAQEAITEPEEEAQEAVMGAGLLDGIDKDIKAWGKIKGLPQEAKDRVAMIRGMIASTKAKLKGHGDAIGKALKANNIEEIGNCHKEMCKTLTNGLKRICREMDQLASVEDMPEEATQQLLEMQSASQASHDMFKGYVEKDFSVDGDATEQEPDDDELEGMETKETDDPNYQRGIDDAMNGYPIDMDLEGDPSYMEGYMLGEVRVALNTRQVKWDDSTPSESLLINPQFTDVRGGWGVIQSSDGWYVGRMEGDRPVMSEGPFASEQDARTYLQEYMPTTAVGGKAYSVQEDGGQFWVMDDEGNMMAGPYASQEEADMNRYELESQAINYASYRVNGKDTILEEDPMMIGDGDKDISEQVMLYDANTNKPLRPATPEEIEACQQSPSGMIDVGGTLCYVKSFELKGKSTVRSADSIALKLIGLLADGKGKEMSASVRKMLRKSLSGKKDAYDEGWMAGHNDEGIESNPYIQGTEDYAAWLEGWKENERTGSE